MKAAGILKKGLEKILTSLSQRDLKDELIVQEPFIGVWKCVLTCLSPGLSSKGASNEAVKPFDDKTIDSVTGNDIVKST